MRVSRSGAVRSAMRPHSKRLRSRSSRVRMAFGGRSLLAVLVDRVERVEELFLGPLLVGDELDVVDEQQVDLAVTGPELVDLALLDARDELVGELLAGGVDDPLPRQPGEHLVADGVHEVRLAEAHSTVEEERVVGVPGSLGDRQAGRVRQPVGRTDDEGAEGVARVEADGRPLAPDPGRLQADRAGILGAFAHRRGCLADLELDGHAVAHDASQRLADQRAVAGLQPVLGEAVGDRHPEAAVIHLHQRGVAQPRLVVGGRQGHLKFAQRGTPHLLRVHR